MARNKYPEITVDKILEVSKKLFLEKGFEHTTIQDIVNELGGLTKGAIYHHFKSKEEILDAIGDKMYFENNPFDKIGKRNDLNALEKMQEIVKNSYLDNEHTEIMKQSIPLLKNPHILAQTIEANRVLISPQLLSLINEGICDGSIQTKYAKELAEVLQLLTSIWMLPSVYPGSSTELKNRFSFLRELLEKMGLPIIDDELQAFASEFYDSLSSDT